MRLIDADALMHIYTAETKHCADIKSPAKRGWQGACQLLYDAPAIDAVPVVHGRWLNNGIHGSVLCRCSECHYDAAAYSFRYCPMCGAKMDGEGDVKCQN